jgi:hypothetical protein
MRRLFDIGDDLLAIDGLIDDLDGDVSDPAVEAALGMWFDESQAEEGVKLDGYAGYIRQLEHEATIAKAEAEEYRRRAQIRENRVAWLKARLIQHLQRTGRTKVATATGRTIALQQNVGKAPVVLSEDAKPSDFGPEFHAVSVRIDVDKVREHLEAGGILAGAKLGERGVHLRIR